MEQKPRRKKNSTRVNATISIIFHGTIVVLLFFVAAREGILGKQLKKIAVTMAPKEKPPEKPKEKPPEPKEEPPKEVAKAEAPKTVTPPPAKAATAPPPATTAAPPPAAPPAAAIAALDFSDGAKIVQSTSDPSALYKGLVEYAFRSKWNRPENMSDESFVAEVEVIVDPAGKITGSQWKRGSGDPKWDASVKTAVAQTKSLSRPPPKGFPEKFLVRFDVQAGTEPLTQASVQ